jgi:hypothetical protein
MDAASLPDHERFHQDEANSPLPERMSDTSSRASARNDRAERRPRMVRSIWYACDDNWNGC